MQHYTLTQWNNTHETASRIWTHDCALETTPDNIGLFDGLQLAIDTLAENTSAPRWFSTGAEYVGRHSLKGWKRGNAMALEWRADVREDLIAALERLDLYAAIVGTRAKANASAKRCTVILPLDNYADDTTRFTDAVCWLLEDIAVKGFIRGEACTFLFNIDPSEALHVNAGSKLVDLDELLNRTGMKFIAKWKDGAA